MGRWVVLLVAVGCHIPTEPAATDASSSGCDGSSTTFSTSFTGSGSATTTTSSTSSTDDDGGTNTDGGSFVIVPDWGGGEPICGGRDADHAMLRCDPNLQDCPRGEKCSPHWIEVDGAVNTLGNACVPVSGSQGLGEPCTIEGGPGSPCDDCDSGLRCWPNADGPQCTRFCSPYENPRPCRAGTVCAWMWDAYFPLCLPACDPLAPTCGEGFGCVPTTLDEFVCFPALVGEPAALDELCMPEGELPCAAGLACIDAVTLGPACMGESGCCRPLCDLAGAACQVGTCVTFFADPPPQYASLGWCAEA